MSECVIALVDCDSFFASCEQAINAEIQGKPVCVLSNNDGCVVARSKEAKELGVKMGMPYFMAKKQFPEAIYISGNHSLYGDFSRKVMAVLRDFSPDVEVYSIDEAFVGLSGLKKLYKMNYFKMAKSIREKIKTELGINVSVGVSTSKVLAKLACEKAKGAKVRPYTGTAQNEGVCIISKSKIPQILKNTKVQEIWGIGRNTTVLFNKNGIINCAELVEKPDGWLKSRFGKNGVELKHELLGECIYKVKTQKRLPKSIQNTRSFPKFTNDINYIKNALNVHIHTSCRKLRRYGGKCKTVSVMLRTKDFNVYWDKQNLKQQTNFELEISKIAMKILDKLYSPDLIYRSCGVTLENLDFEKESQLDLFADYTQKNFDKLADAIDNLETKFGKNVVRTGFFKDATD